MKTKRLLKNGGNALLVLLMLTAFRARKQNQKRAQATHKATTLW
jgi:hypothetical protein